jgi:hypothetical protein
MNCVICKKDGTIFRVVKNAVRRGNVIEGETGKWAGKPELFDIVWTEQELTPIQDKDGKRTGYAETIADIRPAPAPKGREQHRLSRAERIADLVELAEKTEQKEMSREDLDAAVRLLARLMVDGGKI